MSNVLLAAPVRFDTVPVLRVTCNAVSTDITLSVTTGRNYWVMGDAQADASTYGGVGDLLTIIATDLDTHSELAGTNIELAGIGATQPFGIVISSTATAGEFTLNWTHANTTLDSSMFVLGCDTSSDTTSISEIIDSPNKPNGIFVPSMPLHLDSREKTALVGSSSRSGSGNQRTSIQHATPKSERDIGFMYLAKERALNEYAPSDEPFNTAQYLSDNMWRQGQRLRYYADEESLTSSDYTLYKCRNAPADMLTQHPGDLQTYFDFSLPLVRAD